MLVIRDRNDRVLAGSRPSYNLYVVPKMLDMSTTWPKLKDVPFLGISVLGEAHDATGVD